jgi:cytoskeletal protein RodZ
MGGGAEVVSTRRKGMDVLEVVEKKFLERFSMKRYLKFAASFWVSAFLMAGSMAVAQTASTAKTKKKTGTATNSAPTANTTSSGQTQSGTAPADSSAPQTTAAPTGTTTTPPKMMVGPDKHLIPVPQE